MAFHAKRQFQRGVLREGIKISTMQGVEYATYEDLSAGGLKIWLDHDLPMGSLLKLDFTCRLSDGKPVALVVSAVVVRCVSKGSGYEIGVKFVDLPAASQTELQKQFDSGSGPF